MNEPSRSSASTSAWVMRLYMGMQLVGTLLTFVGLRTMTPYVPPAELQRLQTLNLVACVAFSLLFAGSFTRWWRTAVMLYLVLSVVAIIVVLYTPTADPVIAVLSASYVPCLVGIVRLAWSRRRAITLGIGALLAVGGLVWTNPSIAQYGLSLLTLVAAASALTIGIADVSREIERARARLARDHDRLRLAIEASTSPLFVLDANGHVLESNRAASAMLAGQADRGAWLAGDVVRAGLTHARTAGRWEGVIHTNRTGGVFAGILLFHDDVVPDEAEVPTGGSPAFFSLLMRDISVEQRLRRIERLDTVGQLAGGIAHDFNNALTIITATGSVLRDELPSSLHGDVDAILEAASGASELTRRMLALSRHVEIERTRIEVAPFVSATLAVVRRALGAQVQVDLVVPDEPIHIEGDAIAIEHALLNLAVNARDAMGGTGRIDVTVRRVDIDEELARSYPPILTGTFVAIDVRDSGPGIPVELQERIWEPFFSTKDIGKGTGLGLASVHATLVGHGGTVSLSSEPGQGATFRLLLPAAVEVQAMVRRSA